MSSLENNSFEVLRGVDMKILITGSAGFIGFHLLNLLLKQGYQVIGLDNLNDHCGPELKENRLSFIAKIRQPYIP